MQRAHAAAIVWICLWALAGAALDAYASLSLNQLAFSGWRAVAALMELIALLGLWPLRGFTPATSQRTRSQWRPNLLLLLALVAALAFMGWQAYRGYYRTLIQQVNTPD